MQVWYLICSCVGEGGGVMRDWFSPTSSSYPSYSPYLSERFVLGGGFVCLQCFCYMCVCVCLAHLIFYGRENNSVKCRNG